jgi:hypothetical protein
MAVDGRHRELRDLPVPLVKPRNPLVEPRRRPESNRFMAVLQTARHPLRNRLDKGFLIFKRPLRDSSD